MRILGIDWGRERMGLAISDPENIIAFPLEVVEVNKVLDRISALDKIYKFEKVVIGLPLRTDGKCGEVAEEVYKFSDELTKVIHCGIVFQDERFSSKEVEKILSKGKIRAKVKKQIKDKIAAARILQNFLDRQKTND